MLSKKIFAIGNREVECISGENAEDIRLGRAIW
jgi:hypothetical protein